jgi:hypothetical protein
LNQSVLLCALLQAVAGAPSVMVDKFNSINRRRKK